MLGVEELEPEVCAAVGDEEEEPGGGDRSAMGVSRVAKVIR
jgi:hypothetical protein